MKNPVANAWRACLAGTLMLVSGCGTTGPLDWIRNGFKVGPNYGRPPAPVAKEWIDASDPRVENRHLDDWWHVFEDSTLDDLIRTAYRQDLNLRVVGARVLEARAQQMSAVGNLFPQTQQAGMQYSRVNLSPNMPNDPAALDPLLANIPGVTSLVPRSEIPTNYYSEWTAGFNLSWELDFWGRYRRAIESANAGLDASVENFDDALVTLLADVAMNYVQFRVAQQRIKIARDNVRIQRGIVALTAERFRVGTANRLDVEQARTILAQTMATIPALQIVQGQANDNLCVLLGVPPHDLETELGPGPKLGSNPITQTPGWVAAGVPADLIRRRPDVRSAERQVAAQTALIGVAEADLYPAFFINGTIGYDAQELSKLFDANSFTGSVTPSFRWNILNYGRVMSGVHLQEARTQELIATYQNRVLTAEREVQSALRGFLRSQEQARSLRDSVDAAGAAAELGVEQYRTGVIDFNRVFNLEVAQVQQQDQLATAQGEIALNLINVYRALGGGWQIRCQNGHDGSAKLTGIEPANPVEEMPTPRTVPQVDTFAHDRGW